MPDSPSSVVLLDLRLGPVLPAAALGALRSADAVFAAPDLPDDVRTALGVEAAPADLAQTATHKTVVLIATEAATPPAPALLAAGATLVASPAPVGVELLDAVVVIDRLRSPGGCPWDAEQSHESLRQYLVEETYELLEAIEDGDRTALLEELGDVLLQVLFHARIAAEDPADPFTVDEVAGGLVGKLVGRHPNVFVGADPAVWDAASQEHRWEELKQAEKQRTSSVDGVALGQPALSLAAKLVRRATRAGVPAELFPLGQMDSGDPGDSLFALAKEINAAGVDPEDALRSAARRFIDKLRAAEKAARAAGLDPLNMDKAAWLKCWPQ